MVSVYYAANIELKPR